MKAPSLFTFLLLFPFYVFSQCLTAPAPPGCTGSEPLAANNDIVTDGVTKWHYGPTTTLGDFTLRGGTLVVCSELIIDRFYMDSGTIYIHPGARLVITSGIGAGLIFRGNCYIYNYGTCEIQRNLSLDPGATATRPNIVINASWFAVFKMGNQYLVINNPYSRFVNYGYAECWGIITDPQSPPSAVCLGNRSITSMAVLINKVANSYVVPNGTACVYVRQFSQFFGRLTNSTGLLACLGSSHTSDAGCIPHGCLPNNWGSAQVFTSCNSCHAVTALQVNFTSFTASHAVNGSHLLSWQVNASITDGTFTILRSGDGIRYYPIDSIKVTTTSSKPFNSIDKNPLPGDNYYMIKYTSPSGHAASTKIARLYAEQPSGVTIYPVPFDQQFSIHYGSGEVPEKFLLTDITGKNIRTRHTTKRNANSVEVVVLDKIEPGVYIIHIQTRNNYIAQTIIKR